MSTATLSRKLRRLEALARRREQLQSAGGRKLPSNLLEILRGVVPLEDLDSETRAFVEPLLKPQPDYVEEYIGAVAAGQVPDGENFLSFCARRETELK